jgi:hypothetical protein
LNYYIIIGSDENGREEPAALADGYREAASWAEALTVRWAFAKRSPNCGRRPTSSAAECAQDG